MTNDLLTQVQNQLLAAACQCLNEKSTCLCPCRVFISAGPPVADDCECGQLTIHTERLFVHGNFPAELGTVNTCMAPLAAEMNMTLFRCWPTVKDDGSAPTIDELGAAAELIYEDQYILTRCIICNLAARSKRQLSVFRGSRIIAPQGGCIGVEVRFVIQLPDPLPF